LATVLATVVRESTSSLPRDISAINATCWNPGRQACRSVRVTVRVRDGLPDRARSGHARAESTGLQRVGDLTRGVRSSPRSGTLRASPGSPGTARVCPQGRSKRALAVPGGSGVGLCLPGRGDDPLLHLRGRAGVRGRAPRYADGFTGSWRSCRRELDCQLGKSVALYCRHLAVC
jgi:hypothetical protein